MLELEDVVVAQGIQLAVKHEKPVLLQVLAHEARARISGSGLPIQSLLKQLPDRFRVQIVADLLEAKGIHHLHNRLDSTLAKFGSEIEFEKRSVCGRFIRWVQLQLSRAPFAVLSALLQQVEAFAQQTESSSAASAPRAQEQDEEVQVNAAIEATFSSSEWQPYLRPDASTPLPSRPTTSKYSLQEAQERVAQAVDRGALNTAEEAIHNLFDLHLFRPASTQARPVTTGESITGDPPIMPTSAGATHSRRYKRRGHLRHHYVLLSKAEMYLWFGESAAAIHCLFEAVQMAQANGDAKAVAFILHVLGRLRCRSEEGVPTEAKAEEEDRDQHLGVMARSPGEFLGEAHQRAAQLRLWRLQSATASGLSESGILQIQDWETLDPVASGVAAVREYGLVDGDEAWAAQGKGRTSIQPPAAVKEQHANRRTASQLNAFGYSQSPNTLNSQVLASLSAAETRELRRAHHAARQRCFEQQGLHLLAEWEQRRQAASLGQEDEEKEGASAAVMELSRAQSVLSTLQSRCSSPSTATVIADKLYLLSVLKSGGIEGMEALIHRCFASSLTQNYAHVLNALSSPLVPTGTQNSKQSADMQLLYCRYLLDSCCNTPTILIELLRPLFNSLATILKGQRSSEMEQRTVLLLMEALYTIHRVDDACRIAMAKRDVLCKRYVPGSQDVFQYRGTAPALLASVESCLAVAKCFLVKYQSTAGASDAAAAIRWLRTAESSMNSATSLVLRCKVHYYQALCYNAIGDAEQRENASALVLQYEQQMEEDAYWGGMANALGLVW